MKKMIVALCLGAALALAALSVFATPGVQFNGVQINWTPPANFTPDAYNIYTTDSLTAPVQWTLVQSVPGTQTSASFIVTPGAHFYALTAQNFWGESNFSEPVSTPAVLPSSGVNLSIQGVSLPVPTKTAK